MPNSPRVTQAVIKIIETYDSFALLMIKNMNEKIANNVAQTNGIDELIKSYIQNKHQVVANLLRAVLSFQTTSKFSDVKSLFRLSTL